ncbi:amino acid adenylation domain-containing protein [Lentzea sp. NPDC058436]|uniref:non-ribosomal peptide synthetase n=1 Tax=Lentzea sp. NPDC058436 TaxID=3346499 RepID=UPI00365728AE
MLAEVARRLDRELEVFEEPGSEVVVGSRDGDGGPGPAVRVGPQGLEVTCPLGDLWESAIHAVAEMCVELLNESPAAAGMSEKVAESVFGELAGVEVDHGPYRSVPRRIWDTAASRPDAVAVHAGDGTLTYGQLLGQATALASRLRAVTTPGSLVPVLVADGLALPVSWTAVMLAGTGYVPIDPRWPVERITQVLDLVGGPVVCVDPEAVPVAHRGRALLVDPADPGEPVQGEAPDLGEAEVVYGIYTSGTTGTPLCAVNLHGGLANRLSFMDRWFGEPPSGREVVLQSTRHTYDSAFWQIFWPLTTGGTTVVPDAGDLLDLEHTIDLVEAHGVTVTDFVPAVLSALLALVEQRPALVERLRSLRHVVVGGEQIIPQDVHRLRELLPGLRVSNAYGPSEASIGMIFHDVRAEDGDEIPLGRPIDNCVAVVVDVDGRPLPPGATGEIVIGGACVGAGYHGEPHRTAARFFTSDWFGAERAMYRTGDLGRLDENGRFRFAGRIDHQIKIGGVRVEPGEVEAVSLACEGVRQSVAMVVGASGDRELVLAMTGTATSGDVLDVLRARLPRGAVPSRVVNVGQMPLTGPGKIDRRRLADLLELSGEPSDDADPVLALLREVLRRPLLTAEDGFFAAGGDSLRALRAVLGLRELTGVEVGVRDLVDHPTAAQLRILLARRATDGVAVPSQADLATADLAALTATPRGLRSEPADGPVRTVLLTGATGFVGARLLHELLERTDLAVVCLVRGDDDAHAERRVLAALAAQGLGLPDSRMTAVAGDLAKPGLGLTPERWRALAAECDLIVHNGALVNLLYDYRMHREPNVLGTAEVIRFARAAGCVPLHHVSTLGVLHDHALRVPGMVPEHVDLAGVTPPSSGYSLSKWVAERLVRAATDLPVTVLRLGEVMPATDVPVPNPAALTTLLLKAFDRLGVVPDAAIRSDVSPVDEVARAVVETVADPAAWGRAWHLFRDGSVHFGDLTDATPVSCLRFLGELRRSGDADLATLLAIVEHRCAGAAGDEDVVRRVLEDLLQDNPALFAVSDARPKKPARA